MDQLLSVWLATITNFIAQFVAWIRNSIAQMSAFMPTTKVTSVKTVLYNDEEQCHLFDTKICAKIYGQLTPMLRPS